MGLLRATSNQLKGTFEIGEGSLKVGRGRDNEIRLPHKSVSRHHAAISEEDGRLLIKDFASSYGCYINEAKITTGYAEDGDVVRFGRIRLAYQTSLDPIPDAAKPLAVLAAKSNATERDDAAPEPVELPTSIDGPRAKPTVITKPCERHPKLNISLICPKCSLKFCTDCVKTVKVEGNPIHLCRFCKESCNSLEEHQANLDRQQARESRTFIQSIPEVLQYPFTSNGIWTLLIGTLLYVVLAYTAQFDLRVAVVASGYLLAYLLKIVVAASKDEPELPDWPDFMSPWQEIIRPCLMVVSCGIASFSPLLVYLYLLHSDGGNSRPTIMFPLAAWGLLYFPISVLAVGITKKFIHLSPITFGQALVRLSGQYMFAAGLLLLMVILRYLLNTFLVTSLSVPVVPTLLTGLLSLYFLAVFVRLMGVIYYRNRRELGWLEA